MKKIKDAYKKFSGVFKNEAELEEEFEEEDIPIREAEKEYFEEEAD